MTTEIAKPGHNGWPIDEWVANSLVDWAAGSKAAAELKAGLRWQIRQVADDLAGPAPSPIERTLAETAALAWFALRLHEGQFAGGSSSDSGLTIKQADFRQRRLDRAHRRYLATLKTLATIRRLSVPALQINVDRRQVNVAGPLTLPPGGAND